MQDGMIMKQNQSLEKRIAELLLENDLLKESVKQGDRIRKQWNDAVIQLKKGKKETQENSEVLMAIL